MNKKGGGNQAGDNTLTKSGIVPQGKNTDTMYSQLIQNQEPDNKTNPIINQIITMIDKVNNNHTQKINDFVNEIKLKSGSPITAQELKQKLAGPLQEQKQEQEYEQLTWKQIFDKVKGRSSMPCN